MSIEKNNNPGNSIKQTYLTPSVIEELTDHYIGSIEFFLNTNLSKGEEQIDLSQTKEQIVDFYKSKKILHKNRKVFKRKIYDLLSKKNQIPTFETSLDNEIKYHSKQNNLSREEQNLNTKTYNKGVYIVSKLGHEKFNLPVVEKMFLDLHKNQSREYQGHIKAIGEQIVRCKKIGKLLPNNTELSRDKIDELIKEFIENRKDIIDRMIFTYHLYIKEICDEFSDDMYKKEKILFDNVIETIEKFKKKTPGIVFIFEESKLEGGKITVTTKKHVCEVNIHNNLLVKKPLQNITMAGSFNFLQKNIKIFEDLLILHRAILNTIIHLKRVRLEARKEEIELKKKKAMNNKKSR